MTFIFGKLVWAVVQPGNLLLLCLLVGVFLVLRGRRRGELVVVLAAIGLLLLAVAPVGPALLLVLEQRFPRPLVLPDRIDGILVLGGAVDPGLSLTYREPVFNNSVARVLAGVALARKHPEAKLALVGGEGELFPVGFAEAHAMQAFALDEGIPATRIILEERSRSTHENAVFAKELIRPAPDQHWVLVTSAFPRTGLRANFSLLDGLNTSTTAGKEWAGLVGYRFRGWTRELFPAPPAGPNRDLQAVERAIR